MVECDEKFNRMQQAKRMMFAMRNGVVADVLRKGGSPFSIIFGVNLPQLTDMARELGTDNELAARLWANTTTRESMLLAPMLVDADNFSEADAAAWIESVPCNEVADVLCLKLLRRLPYARELVMAYHCSDDRQQRYTALRLMCNLARQYPDMAREVADGEAARTDGPMMAMVERLRDC